MKFFDRAVRLMGNEFHMGIVEASNVFETLFNAASKTCSAVGGVVRKRAAQKRSPLCGSNMNEVWDLSLRCLPLVR